MKNAILIIALASITTSFSGVVSADARYGKDSPCPSTPELIDTAHDAVNFENEGDVDTTHEKDPVGYKVRLNKWTEDGAVNIDIKGPHFEVFGVALQTGEKGKTFNVCGRQVRFSAKPCCNSKWRVVVEPLKDF